MIVFDVGANDGKDSLRWEAEHGATVYAFEPAPLMLDGLRKYADRIHVIGKAVSDFDGEAEFHLSELSDHGCSSLYEFSPDIEQTWPGRSDLKFTRTITVPVTRLDTFMAERGIDHVHHLHIDAQGADLAVLRGLGERYTDVDGGVLEAASRRDVALYQGVPVLDDVLDWLARHDFEVVRTDEQSKGNEVNVTFRRAE